MKTIIAIFIIIVVAVPVLAGPRSPGDLIENRVGTEEIQAFCPDADKSVAVVSITSQVFNLGASPGVPTSFWVFTPDADCYGRLMKTASKGTYPQFKMYAESPFGRGVHPNSTFLNISGCTGLLERQ